MCVPKCIQPNLKAIKNLIPCHLVNLRTAHLLCWDQQSFVDQNGGVTAYISLCSNVDAGQQFLKIQKNSGCNKKKITEKQGPPP